jgi:hypothetical protein
VHQAAFTLNGVSIARLSEKEGKSRYRLLPPKDFPGMRHLDFTIDWSEAPEDSKTLEVIDYAARRAVRSVRDDEPRWLTAYCGTP